MFFKQTVSDQITIGIFRTIWSYNLMLYNDKMIIFALFLGTLSPNGSFHNKS